jgi:predicted TPR repeat methyltransferase
MGSPHKLSNLLSCLKHRHHAGARADIGCGIAIKGNQIRYLARLNEADLVSKTR